MEFRAVQNHDDYYSLDTPRDDVMLTGSNLLSGWKSAITCSKTYDPHFTNATPHVQDNRGFFIVYDAALADLEDLSNELLLMASYFIEKDAGRASSKL